MCKIQKILISVLVFGSYSSHSQTVAEEFHKEPIELIIRSNARVNNVDDASFSGTMTFVFFQDYIFHYSKLIKEQKSINSKTGEVTAFEYNEGVAVRVNHKNSDIDFLLEDEFSGVPEKYGESPRHKESILNYFLLDGFKSSDLIVRDLGDTIYLTETITSSIGAGKPLKYITVIKKIREADDDKMHLFHRIEMKY